MSQLMAKTFLVVFSLTYAVVIAGLIALSLRGWHVPTVMRRAPRSLVNRVRQLRFHGWHRNAH